MKIVRSLRSSYGAVGELHFAWERKWGRKQRDFAAKKRYPFVSKLIISKMKQV